ncbi:RedB protein [Fimbriimonas ginsengisoli Gsoil 348]|uniref:RedB protein n=2 Tax=Fimbriimonas ginsengisoli TaxID=1005039 RepID=A0A068NKZ5_FIMGI|nr:RedB protein [Fimbriimonas ginsengisoli Gsoil 348]
MRWEFTPGPIVGAEPLTGSRGLELVMVAHPFCPCTAASLNQLRDIVVQSQGKLRTRIVFVGANMGSPSPNERAAQEIPDAGIQWVDAKQAQRFGAITSGHVTLYRDGVPIFEGGITASRGVVGDSAGQRAIETALRGQKPIAAAPVYGCALTPGESP